MALWDTMFGVGAQQAPDIMDAYYKGRSREMADFNAQEAAEALTMKQLEDAVMQPDRLAKSYGETIQGINVVRPNVVKDAGGFDSVTKLEQKTDKALTAEEMKQAIADKYGGGDFKKAQDYFKDQKLKPGDPAFDTLVSDAVEGYKSMKANKGSVPAQRTPQGFGMEDLVPIKAVRDEKGNLTVQKAPVVVQAPPQVVVQPEITPEQMLASVQPQVQPATVVEGNYQAPDNMFDPRVRMQHLNEALQRPMSDAELELTKGQQSNNFMAQKMMAEQLFKKQLQDQQLAAEAEQKTATMQAEMDKTNKTIAAQLLGHKMQADATRRAGGAGNSFAEKLDLKTIGDLKKAQQQIAMIGGAENPYARKMAKQVIDSQLTPQARAKAEEMLGAYVTPSVKGQAVNDGKITVRNPKTNKRLRISPDKLSSAQKDGWVKE